MPSSTLTVTGVFVKQRLVVFVRGKRCGLPVTPFVLLLELVAARLRSKSGVVYSRDAMASLGDPEYTRTLAKRIRDTCGSWLLENAKGGYALNVAAREIVVDESVFELPPHVVPAELLTSLRAAHDTRERLSRSTTHVG